MAAHKLNILILSCITIFFVSCDVEVPIKEMVKARTTIEKARQVNAEKYDPDNYAKATEQLKLSHDSMVDKKGSNAKKAAIESANFADLAIQTSLPKITDDTLVEAKTLYKESEALNAEQFASEKYAQTGNAIIESEKLKGDQKLWEAFQKAKDAVALGKETKELCLAKVPQLNETIGGIKKEIEELNSKNLSDQQKQDLAAAGANCDKAGTLIAQNNVKEAVPLIAESEKAVKKVQVAVLKLSSKERITQLRKEVDALKKERGSEFAGEDIEVVVAALNEADSLLDQDKTDEANKKIADAESSLTIAKEKTIKGIAQDKARSVEKLLDETRTRDTKNQYKDQTDSAATMISDGNKLFEGGSYKESISKYNEAESLLYSLGIAGEKDASKHKGFLQKLEGKAIYKVVYNKKKRDCLWRIAHKVYRNAKLWPLIYMANKDQIKDPDLIFPGQKFVIPEIPEKKEVPEKETSEEKTSEKETSGTKEPEKEKTDDVPKETVDEEVKE
ncbi:MAG: LysM peptidoglycan-binding domain-containing protein [Spirochaetes bacterium]|nr:LysM peptidoglycan-binding domain-containing protein [Spirochaetota bacterium]